MDGHSDVNELSTPINKITREDLPVLIKNNVLLNQSLEFDNYDSDRMETDSPIRKVENIQPVSKKLFHSPLVEEHIIHNQENTNQQVKGKIFTRTRKRKRSPLRNSNQITKAYIRDHDREGVSPIPSGGLRKKILISLFSNREYSMDNE